MCCRYGICGQEMTCPPGRWLHSFLEDPGTTSVIFSKLACIQRKTKKEHKNPESLPDGCQPFLEDNLCLIVSHFHHTVNKTVLSLLFKNTSIFTSAEDNLIGTEIWYMLSSVTALSILLRTLQIPGSLFNTYL